MLQNLCRNSLRKIYFNAIYQPSMALVENRTSVHVNRLTARHVCTFSSQSPPVDREQYAKVISKPNIFKQHNGLSLIIVSKFYVFSP